MFFEYTENIVFVIFLHFTNNIYTVMQIYSIILVSYSIIIVSYKDIVSLRIIHIVWYIYPHADEDLHSAIYFLEKHCKLF